MNSPTFITAAVLLAAGVLFALAILGRFLFAKKAKETRQLLDDLQKELQHEQGKAGRLAGFIERLQPFGISSTGQAPTREFAEALVDSVSHLLNAEQAVLFLKEASSPDLLPVAGRGIAPDVLARLRVRAGETALGKAAQTLRTVLQNSPAPADGNNFFSAPFLIIPLVSQSACTGLLLMAQPQEGSFSAEDQETAGLFARQASLTLEDHRHYEDLGRLCGQVVSALVCALEAKDSYTHKHSDRTRGLVRAFAQDMSLPDFLIREIEYGALLHDIGKIGIPGAILTKPDKLTAEEYAVMKKHPAVGHRIVQPIEFLRQVAPIVLYHQEWYNGAGYPEGLAGEEIPLGARIVQIIDAWDAMTSDRPYRKAMTKPAAIAEMRRQEGTQFDPKLVAVFLRALDRLEREGIPTTEQNVGSAVAAGQP